MHLLHWKVPDEIPAEMEKVCSDLRECKNQSETVRKAYEIVTSRFAVSRLHTYLRLGALMDKNLHSVWHRTEYLHCTHLNHLMKVLLVHSGWFHSRDIRIRWTLVWGISPHQYLRIRLNDGSHIAPIRGAARTACSSDHTSADGAARSSPCGNRLNLHLPRRDPSARRYPDFHCPAA